MLDLTNHRIETPILHIRPNRRHRRMHDLLKTNRIIDRQRTTRKSYEQISRTLIDKHRLPWDENKIAERNSSSN